MINTPYTGPLATPGAVTVAAGLGGYRNDVMDGLSVSQRRMVAVANAAIGLLCLGAFVYWAAIVVNHPWFKHTLLFGVLTVVAFAVAGALWPRGSRGRQPVGGDDASPLT